MKRALLKWTLRTVVAIVIVAGLAATSLVVVMNTERGTRWAMDRIVTAVPGELVIGDFRGTLWRGLQFSRVQYRFNRQKLDASDFEIEINWVESAVGQLRLRRLRAATLVIEIAESDNDPTSGLDVRPAPFDVQAATLSIDELQIDTSNRQTRIHDIRMRNARYAGNTATVRSVALVYDELAIQARALSLKLQGDGPLGAEVEWQLANRGWAGVGSLDGTLAAIRFVQQVEGPLPGRATGELFLLGRSEPVLSVNLLWDTWNFDAFDLLDGEVSATGDLDDYQITAARAVLLNNGREIRIAGSGRGNRLELESFESAIEFAIDDTFRVNANAEGRVAWQPDVRAETDFRADAVLGAQSLAARGRLRYAPQSVQCLTCELRSGANIVAIDGTLSGDSVSARLNLDMPDVGQLLPDYAGAVTGTATLSTVAAEPRIVFNLRGRGLAALQLPGYAIDGTARGSMQSRGDDVLTIIDSASLAEVQAGEWRLQDRLEARWSDSGLVMTPHSWAGDLGTLHVSSASFASQRFGISAYMRDIPLSIANTRLPPNMRLAGHADADIDMQRADSEWSGTLSWRQQNTTLTVTDVLGETTTIVVPEAAFSSQVQDGRVSAEATLAIEPAASASLRLELAEPARDAPLQAELQLQGDDFSWISALVPYIDQVGGSVAAEIQAAGRADAPEFLGTATWRDGRLLLPAYNVPINDINLTVSGASAGNLRLAGAAKAGDGQLELEGEVFDVMSRERSFELAIAGTDAELVNWPEYRLWATPDIDLVARGGNWRYSGSVMVPRAEVRLRELPTGAITVSDDVVVLGESTPEVEQIRWSGEARIELGDRVHFRALGLDTRLAGDLRVRAQPDRPTALHGAVSLVDGAFEAYGQKLTIREGTLTFTGPVDDPLVDVRAVRVIDTFDGVVTAGIHVYGRAQNLTSTVFSEPSMADADALSYLVIGRPLNEATEAEGNDLSGAAVALGLRQATRLTQQIGQSVGLDQLAVTGDGGDTTALVAGKQINTRLYARYAYGVFNRIGALLLRYRLTPNVTLEAGAGETQSIDVLYSIERD